MSITVQSQMNSNHFASGVNEVSAHNTTETNDYKQYMFQRKNVIHRLTEMVVNHKHMVTPLQKIGNIASIYMYIDEYVFPLVGNHQDPKLMTFVVHAFNRSYDFQEQMRDVKETKKIKDIGMRTLFKVRARLASTIQENLHILQPNEQTKLALERIRNMENEPQEEPKQQRKRNTKEKNEEPTVLRRSPRNVPRVNYAGMA